MRETAGVVRRGASSRRRFIKEFRRQVVEETLAPGASVAGVALRHRLNANLVFTWRRKLLPILAPMRMRSVKLLPERAPGVRTSVQRLFENVRELLVSSAELTAHFDATFSLTQDQLISGGGLFAAAAPHHA